MSTIGNVSLQSDENGLISLECNRCKSIFKIDSIYLHEELSNDICCPVCGISGQLDSFFTEEVIEEAIEMTKNEAEKLIQDVFNGLKSKHIKVKMSPVARCNRNIVIKNKDYDMQVFTLECCQKKMALKPIDAIAGFYCPYCGRIVK